MELRATADLEETTEEEVELRATVETTEEEVELRATANLEETTREEVELRATAEELRTDQHVLLMWMIRTQRS